MSGLMTGLVVVLRENYLSRWTKLNTLRTIAAIAAAMMYALALR